MQCQQQLGLSPSGPLQAALLSAKSCLHEALQAQEIHWKQRSRITWLKEGDQNTKFFHQSAKARSSFNKTSHITIDGMKTEDPATIQSKAVKYFSNLFKPHDGHPNPLLFQIDRPKASNSDNSPLISMPSEEEIKTYVFSLEKKKTHLAPDGFNGAFYTSTWGIIGKTVSHAVQHFLAKKKSINPPMLSSWPSSLKPNYLTLLQISDQLVF